MARTITPTLDPEVLERLQAYVREFRGCFQRIDQYLQGRIYVHGLLLDGERKSIEPLSRRVPDGDEQRLQQFINQSPWDTAGLLRAYRARMAAAFATPDGRILIDDTGFAKQGKHSVGVARQYSGTLGKRDNCQVAVSLHYATDADDYPLDLRLYLPDTWTTAPDRLDQAYVPEPERDFRTKWQIALERLDRLRAEALPHHLILADAGYGAITAFRDALESRREAYIVGLLGEEVVWTTPPAWVPAAPTGRGRPPTRAYVSADTPAPVPLHDLATTLPRTPVTWRIGLKGALSAEFAWLRVWPAHRWQNGVPADAIPDANTAARWLLVEWRADGTVRYALSNLPPDTTLEQAVAWWKERWPIERGYEQLKDELGLDHFEGRSWAGFHHHAAMTFLAYGFLALERRRAQDASDPLQTLDPPVPEMDCEAPGEPLSTVEVPRPPGPRRRGGSVWPRSVAPSRHC
jgi:SRSO17 transposase